MKRCTRCRLRLGAGSVGCQCVPTVYPRTAAYRLAIAAASRYARSADCPLAAAAASRYAVRAFALAAVPVERLACRLF